MKTSSFRIWNRVAVSISYSLHHDRHRHACVHTYKRFTQKIEQFIGGMALEGTIYQPLRSGRIWHKVNF